MATNFEKHRRALQRIHRRVTRLQQMLQQQDETHETYELMRHTAALISALRRFQTDLLKDCVAQHLISRVGDAAGNGANRNTELTLARLLSSLQLE